MHFEQLAYRAAAVANRAANEVIGYYAGGMYSDEPEITAGLVTMLKKAFSGARFAGLKWSATIMRHYSGRASEEKHFGADLLMQVALNTPQQTYSKGVLVQAKRERKSGNFSGADHNELVDQCGRMLKFTPAAFVFHYTTAGIGCASATLVQGSADRNLGRVCHWGSHRFFLELFRCPIGDPRITIGMVDDIRVRNAIKVEGSGEISLDDDRDTLKHG
jgi:hypothetical protein